MKRKVKVRQHDAYDCGAASLCAVAASYGHPIPLFKARELCGCTKEGITIRGILEAGNALGFKCSAYKSQEKRTDLLEGITLPAIAHLRRDDGLYHYVVVYGISRNRVEIMDPASGEIIKENYAKFTGEWSGYIILFSPTEKLGSSSCKRDTFKRMSTLVWRHKGKSLLAAAGAVTLILVSSCNSIFLQIIIDNALPDRNMALLSTIFGAIAAITLLSLFISYVKELYLIENSISIDKELVELYIKSVFALPAKIYNQFSPGDLNSRIGDVFKIRLFISEGIISIFIGCTTLLVILILMFTYSFQIAFLSLLFIPLYAGLYTLSSRLNKKLGRSMAVSSAKFESEMLFGMDSIIDTRHYCAEEISINKIMEKYNDLACTIYKSAKRVAGLDIASQGLSKTLLAATLALGAFTILGGAATTGELVSFYTLCIIFTSPLNGMINISNLVEQAKVATERLFEIIDWNKYEPAEHSNTTSVPHGDIDICEISFAYPGRREIFNGLTTTIRRGAITVICGGNGCGKSTLTSLLMRDIEPRSGKITAGGKDIREIEIGSWLKFAAVVPQKINIFNGTILENITCGEENPDLERVASIIIETGLADTVSRLPNGIGTHIGSGGSFLSGGELQKTAIARALYRDAQLIIFDEVTSNMDKKSEELFLQLLHKLKKRGKSIAVISHSYNIRHHADCFIDLSAEI